MKRFFNSRLFGAVALAAVVGCKGAQTKTPVVTTTKGDKQNTSESGDAAAKVGKSLVRLVNALPDGKEINVSRDSIVAFSGVAYKAVTPYKEVSDNVVKFQLDLGGAKAAVANNTETLTDGFRYTIVALPKEDGGSQMRIFRDEFTGDSTKARIRVINAAPNLGGVSLISASEKDPIFKDVKFEHEGGFKTVNPQKAVLELRPEKGTAIKLGDMQLQAGKSYTIVITGKAGGKIETIVFDDAVML